MNSSYTVEAVLKATGASQFQQAFAEAEQSMKGFKEVGSQLQGIGKGFMKNITLPVLGVGAAAIKTVASFDDSMASLQKISGATGKEFDALRSTAQELGSTTAFSASEAAEGMGVLAASGMKANDVMAISEDMFNLMSAGSIDAETSARVLTNTMAQFNLTADESEYIVDSFASGAASAKVGVDDLEHAMALAGGSLANMNMSADESVAVMGQLANGAIPVQQLGATVNAMSADIIANADEMSKYAKVYDETTGEMRGMDEIMRDLEQSLEGKTQAEQNAIKASLFGSKAQQGVTAWLNKGADAYVDLTKSMREQENAAKTMALIQEDTLGGAFRAVGSATEGMMIQIGDVIKGPIQQFAIKLQDLAAVFGNLSEPMKKAIVIVAGIAAAIGPVLLVVGKLMTAISGIPAVLAMLTGPVGAVIAGIAAVVAVGALLIKNWEQIKETIKGVMEAIFPDFEQFKLHIQSVWESIKTAFSQGNMESVGEQFGYMFSLIFQRIQEALPVLLEKGLEIVGNIIEGITTMIPTWLAKGMELTVLFATVLADFIPKLLVMGMEFVKGLLQGITERIPEWVAKGAEMVVAMASTIKDNLPKIVAKGQELLSSVVDGFKEKFPEIVSAGWEMIKSLAGELIRNLPTILNAGADILVAVVDGILSMIGSLLSAAGTVVDTVWDTIKETDWISIGKDIISGLASGISASASALWRAAKGVLGSFKDNVTGFFGIKSPSRVMAKEVGQYIPSGIGMGIKKNEHSMVKSAVAMSEKLKNAVNVPTFDVSGRIANSNAQVNHRVSHEINNGHSKQSATFHLHVGRREFKAVVDDITDMQDKDLHFEMSYGL